MAKGFTVRSVSQEGGFPMAWIQIWLDGYFSASDWMGFLADLLGTAASAEYCAIF